MAKTSDSASAEASQPKRGLFSRKPKAAKGPKEPGRLKQIGQVFQMTRRHDPSVVWLMLLAFLGDHRSGPDPGPDPGQLDHVPADLPSRSACWPPWPSFPGAPNGPRSRRSKDRPGAAGAAMSVLRRGWILKDQPVAVDPRTQDLVFRGIGRPGVVLVTEGPSTRVRPLVDAERKRMGRAFSRTCRSTSSTPAATEGQIPASRTSPRP